MTTKTTRAKHDIMLRIPESLVETASLYKDFIITRDYIRVSHVGYVSYTIDHTIRAQFDKVSNEPTKRLCFSSKPNLTREQFLLGLVMLNRATTDNPTPQQRHETIKQLLEVNKVLIKSTELKTLVGDVLKSTKRKATKIKTKRTKNSSSKKIVSKATSKKYIQFTYDPRFQEAVDALKELKKPKYDAIKRGKLLKYCIEFANNDANEPTVTTWTSNATSMPRGTFKNVLYADLNNVSSLEREIGLVVFYNLFINSTTGEVDKAKLNEVLNENQ